jgi:fucose 4-O-acetylase-like acetyltransferase
MEDRSDVAAVDWLKVVAIVAVVMSHSGPFALGPLPPLERWLRVILPTFHVPVFLIVSGYLHAATRPVTWAVFVRRVRRVLGPYVVATVIVTALGYPPVDSLWHLPRRLLLGDTFGIYYFVPVWILCTLTGILWSRLSERTLVASVAALAAATYLRGQTVTRGSISFYWALRDPFLQGWLLCYLLGWCARRNGWDAWLWRHRRRGIAAGVALAAPWLMWAVLGVAPAPLSRVAYATGVACVVFVVLTRRPPRLVRTIASETFLIYLWHFVLLIPLRDATMRWPVVPRLVMVVPIAIGGVLIGVAAWRGAERAVGHRLSPELVP